MVMKLKFRGSGLQHSVGPLALAILLGSVMGACSGTISTPTEEYPARQNDSAADDEDDSDTGTTPRAPASTGSNSTANNDDDDDAPARPTAPAADDDDEAAAADEDEPLPPAEEEEEEAPPPAATALSFEDDIQPIFNTTCGPCHAGQATAGVDIGNDDIDVALESARDREDRVLARIEAGTMPPGCAGGSPGDTGCISETDLADVEAWYAAGAPE
jgi:hypothetical protein